MERERGPKIVVAGGGTGGHLFPALEVADEMRRRHPAASVEFVGAKRGLESRLVPRRGYRLRTLSLRGLQGASGAARIIGLVFAGFAVARCMAWMLVRRPDLVVGAGGYASGPAVLAARWLGVKTMVMEQNHFPGATNRFLAGRVDAVCVPSEAARRRLQDRGIVTGNPVRPAFARAGALPGEPALSLLVFGGSRGASSVNRAMLDALDELAGFSRPPRIVHQTGEDEDEDVRRGYGRYPAGLAEVRSFLDDMPARLAAADLVVSRAGASTLAELAAAGRPAILIPYPWASDDHQRRNAEAVVEAGAAVMLDERDLDGRRLAGTIRSLDADRSRLSRMAERSRGLARPDATERIADVADALLAGRSPESTADHGGDRVS